jgi:YtkA-like protein
VVRRVTVALGLSSLAAAAGIARGADQSGSVGPGPVSTVLTHDVDRCAITISPNIGHRQNTITLRWTRDGHAVFGTARAKFTMTAMAMPPNVLTLGSIAPGVYRGTGRQLSMPGRWQIRFHLSPRRGPPFDVTLSDHITLGLLR